MIKKFLIFLLYLFLGLIVTLNASQNDSQEEKLSERWKKVISLTTIEQTIEEFPYLRQNIKAIKITELLNKGGCKYQYEPARFAIVDNKVYSYGNMRGHERVVVINRYLNQLMSAAKFPDMYFVVHFYDELSPETIQKSTHENCLQLPLFLHNKNGSSYLEKTKFLLPDPFIMNKWQESINEIKQASQQYQWENKISKLYFRGIPSAPHFFDMQINEKTDMNKYFHRGAFVLMSFQHPDLIDANFTKFPGLLSNEIQRRVGDKKIFTSESSLTEHIKYKYLLSADGTGAAWKRVPFIMYSNSLLFKPFSEKVQWFYDKITPDLHFVNIRDDLSDLFSKVEFYNKNSEAAKEIYTRANKLAEQLLNPSAIRDQTKQILMKYAGLQQMSLSGEQKAKIHMGVDIHTILNEQIKAETQLNHLQIQIWKNNNRFLTIEETISTFPFIKQNMEPISIAKMMRQVKCGTNLVSYLILNNKLHVKGGYSNHERTKSITNLLNSILRDQNLPDMYFVVHIEDEFHGKIIPASEHKICRELPLFLMNKNASSPFEQTKFLLPDPFIIDDWAESIRKIKQCSTNIPWDKKQKKAFFRGLASGPYFYEDIKIDSNTDFYQYFHRAAFVLLSNKRPDLVQARFSPKNFAMVAPLIEETKRRVGDQNAVAQTAPQTILCNYRYLLSADGFGAAWRRVPLVLFSNSLLLKPYSQKVQWFYNKMQPNIHYVQIKKDLSNLIAKIQEMNLKDGDIKKIIINANEMAQKYLTPEAIKQYTFNTLKQYSQIQKLSLTQQQKKILASSINPANSFISFQRLNIKKPQINQIKNSNQEQKLRDEKLSERWKKVISLTTIEQTIEEFPYLRQNIKAIKITELLNKGGCKYQYEPARFAIVDNKVYSYGNMRGHERVVVINRYLNQLMSAAKFPDMYFVVHFYDELSPETIQKSTHENCLQLPLFLHNKNGSSYLEKTKFLLPDPFIMNKWQESINEIKQASQQYQWENKISKLYFRGIPSAPHFFDMQINEKTDMNKYFHRGAFVLMSFQHPDLIDANFTKFPGLLSNEIQRRVGDKKIFTSESSLTEHIKYKYLLSADGTGAAWKRVPFIMYSNSLLFKPFSEKVQWFYDKITPDLHFVNIRDDLSDLFSKVEFYNKNSEAAKEIYTRANKLAEQLLNPSAIRDQTKQILMKYAGLQQMSLSGEQKAKIHMGVDIHTILNEQINSQVSSNIPIKNTIETEPKEKQITQVKQNLKKQEQSYNLVLNLSLISLTFVLLVLMISSIYKDIKRNNNQVVNSSRTSEEGEQIAQL